MKRRCVFVFAQDEHGRRCVADAFDLTEESFRSFVLDALWYCNGIAALDPKDVQGNDTVLKVREGCTVEPIDENELPKGDQP